AALKASSSTSVVGRHHSRGEGPRPPCRPHGQHSSTRLAQHPRFPCPATMAPTSLSLLKTLFVPAVVSLLIFLVLTFVLVPVWRRNRNRYSQYLPINSISDRTSSLRHRIVGRFAGLNTLATFLSARQVVFAHGAADDGEELGDVDEETWRAIESHVPSAQLDSSRRLSQDLEEGFMDDSDEEPDRR
ncbi:Uncharacterized protein TPAR_01077, partial [Tolypocladium paradoxum]